MVVPYVGRQFRLLAQRHRQHWCLVPMSWWKKNRQTRNCNAFEKILWFLSFSFDAGTSTKGKYAERLSWLANLCANFFLEENLPLSFYPQICIFSCDHSSLTNIITHHSSLIIDISIRTDFSGIIIQFIKPCLASLNIGDQWNSVQSCPSISEISCAVWMENHAWQLQSQTWILDLNL